MAKKEKFYEYKKINSQGARHHLFRENPDDSWIHHNPDGPAIEPIDENDKSVKKEYYLFGIKQTLEEFKAYQQDRS